MAILEILHCGHPTLRKKAKAVRRVTPGTRRLADDMLETIVEAPGAGLAAPQVGELVRVIVARHEEDEVQLVNPRILERHGEVEGMEGCLSLPGLQGIVVRPEAVVVRGLGKHGKSTTVEAEGWLARIICHEVDHLDGILFPDRVADEQVYWVVRDEEEEDGIRLEQTTVAEAYEYFRREFARARRQKARAIRGAQR